ncbi:SDR family NAD(P)-dependent oxidoreductase [Variovorax sp. RA8]|uniref:SDR family NAD(P)-dependent oxidoreductase n=1 Tax=Variovorax sp. (strain JCM 16519 / RA8) TaxID=662548 RepID=UPI0013174948|nr:SDR family oxidoreductase [Variovorax sp. RA8]VTU41603.1 2,3-dihydro-2,3-dihydroxybenzoate dehydrogenase [Variovorax sp. RA8]
MATTSTADRPQAVSYPELQNLAGRNFVVLGAGQGIGEQCVRTLAQFGARVCAVDVDAARAAAVVGEHRGFGLAADVTRAEEIDALFAEARKRFEARVDGVIDVVGVALDVGLNAADEARVDEQFQIVFRHAWNVLRRAEANVVQGGSVVFVGSIAGMTPRAGALLGYAAAKAALHHVVRGSALELGPKGIRVNAVAPGLTYTPRLAALNDPAFWDRQALAIPLRKVGMPADVASAALFLSSQMASHITGQVLVVDGGSTLTTASAAPGGLSG